MVMRIPLLLAVAGAMLFPAAGDARPPKREQDVAFQGARDGRIIPLREIEARIVPKMRGYQYLGPELDPSSGRYRLKFMRGPQVVWVDVDGQTGQIIDRQGF